MNFVDLNLFSQTNHTPSYGQLYAQMETNHIPLKDYCIPVNPYFPPPAMLEEIKDGFMTALKYYPAQNTSIVESLAEALDLNPKNLIVTNGSTELLTLIDQHFIQDRVAIPIPTFGQWTERPQKNNKDVFTYKRSEKNNFHLDLNQFSGFLLDHDIPVAVICNPNNPTGAINQKEELIGFIKNNAHLSLIVIDESFIDFSQENPPSLEDVAPNFHNVLVLKSLGKNYGLHGIRAGYGVCNEDLATKIKHFLPEWNINGVTELVISLIKKYSTEYEISKVNVRKDRDYLYQSLKNSFFLQPFPSFGNFVYVKIPPFINGEQLRNDLLTQFGLLTRQCSNKIGSSAQYFRIAVRPKEQVDILINALEILIRKSARHHFVC